MPTREEFPDEPKVEALRRFLNVEEPLPLGMRSRTEARVSAERGRAARPGVSFPVVLGLAGFIGGSALQGLQAHSATLIMVLAAGSVAYGLGLRHLVAMADDGKRRVPGDVEGALPDE